MISRIALVTHDYQISGGVSSMTRFLYSALRASDRFEPEIVSLALSASDAASVRLRSPGTWGRGLQRLERSCDGVPFVHVGAFCSELEFQRYRPRPLLTEMLDGYDLVQFVTGTPPWMWAAAEVKRPKFLWTATMTRADRNSRLQQAPPLRRLWLSAMTRMAERYERDALRIASDVFALSDYTLEAVRRLLGRDCGILATCGVDTDAFRPRDQGTTGLQDHRTTGPRDNGYILCVGRLDDPRKNMTLLVQAYAQLRRKFPDAPELWLVGPQPPPDAMSLIGELGLSQAVRWQGPRKPAELPELYKSALCFVLSSDEEGLGIVLLEAMACGVPVVSTACGGPETVIEHARTGFLTPVGDAQALADALGRLLVDGVLRSRMGEEARKVVMERFSTAAASRVFVEKYEQTIASAHCNLDRHLNLRLAGKGQD